MIDVHFTLGEQEYLSATSSCQPYFQRPVPLTRRALASTLLLVIAFAKWKHGPGIDYPMLLQILFAIFWFAGGLLQDKQRKTAFRELNRGEEHWILNHEGLQIQYENRSSQLPWSKFGRWSETKTCFILHSAAHTEAIQILPKRIFDEKTLNEARSLFKDNIDSPRLQY